MAIFRCKLCGGTLDIINGVSVAECEYCGSKQTVPNADSEKKLTLFGRANRLLFSCEFDKASGIYESIVADFPDEAEAYWGLVLCKYGIEYVDDPATGKKVPTCHRSAFDSVMDDENFEQVMETADAVARAVYREEAKKIEELRKGILAVSANEKPYDIFICYKETDPNGERTVDSVMAQEVYDALTEKGYRVFFARITLEDKLGQQYEPYIFSALNSAKIMLVFGTDYEYFNAVWVKNEWSRFLQLIQKGEKKTLIPCYKNIDAYDIPKEFSNLQAQDMGKLGAIQDLIRGISKILPPKNTQVAQTSQPVQQVVYNGPNVDALLKRGYMAIEDGDWDIALERFDSVLNSNSECAEAYLGTVFAELKLKTKEELWDKYIKSHDSVSENKNFRRVWQFALGELKQELDAVEERKVQYELSEAERIKREEEERQARMGRIDAEAEKRCTPIRQKLEKYSKSIAASTFEVVGATNDKKIQAVAWWTYTSGVSFGAQQAQRWQDIIKLDTGYNHYVGLRADGSVYADGSTKDDGRCNVSDWRNIVDISAGYDYTVGVRSDGTAVAVGCNDKGQCNVSAWTDIVAVSAGFSHTLGLRSDGTVVATGSNDAGESDVSEWRGIVAISVGIGHSLGLKRDGTVVAVGDHMHGRCDVQGWTDIVGIAAGKYHSVGLKADGTVVAVGSNTMGQCEVGGWRDAVAVFSGGKNGSMSTVALFANGTVHTTEKNDDAQKAVAGLNLIGGACSVAASTPQKSVHEQMEEEMMKNRQSKGLCRHCGGNFKGFLTKKCAWCGMFKDY